MKISCGAVSSQPIQFAASQLEEYLTRMLSSSAPPLAFQLVVTGQDSHDSFSVDVGPNGGEICGVNDRSVLLGVYDYLHYLG